MEKESLHKRRSRGRFFTKDHISYEIRDVCRNLKPDFILEPFVGAGSLIKPLMEKHRGIANDINQELVKDLKREYHDSRWKFTNCDVISTPLAQLTDLWNIPSKKRLLILTNPPFGTSSTNLLASKKEEIGMKSQSRNIKINYGGLGDDYGRGDLILPAIGKIIELIKSRERGYLAFFAPAGIMLGRVRYKKLLKALLADFKFKEGQIFSGEGFDGVSAKKPIAFTLWKYSPNINTDIETLTLMVDDEPIRMKRMMLLKEGWRYDTRKKIRCEIVVQGNDRFNASPPKIFHLKVEKGGSELIPENIKIDLSIPNIPSELIYGLWSTCVGYRSIAGHPTFIDNAYTHLPNFTMRETIEILGYALLYALITEIRSDYCHGKISFKGEGDSIKFGGDRLTKGANYLIKTTQGCPVGEKTILEVINELKEEKVGNNNISIKHLQVIKREIKKRLDSIGYWDYIPIPSSI